MTSFPVSFCFLEPLIPHCKSVSSPDLLCKRSFSAAAERQLIQNLPDCFVRRIGANVGGGFHFQKRYFRHKKAFCTVALVLMSFLNTHLLDVLQKSPVICFATHFINWIWFFSPCPLLSSLHQNCSRYHHHPVFQNVFQHFSRRDNEEHWLDVPTYSCNGPDTIWSPNSCQ